MRVGRDKKTRIMTGKKQIIGRLTRPTPGLKEFGGGYKTHHQSISGGFHLIFLVVNAKNQVHL